jgi:hypothetical protein
MKRTLFAALLAAMIAAPAARAQGPEPEQEFHQTVARVAFVEGEGSFQRGDDPDHWQPLALNVPMTIGDRIWTGAAGRTEFQAPGLRAFLAPQTELTALNLTEDVQQYSIAEGTASFRLVSMDDDDVFEIDTPNAAVTLEKPGLYRIYVDGDGNTSVSVRRGEARVAAGGGEVSLRTGEQMVVNGLDGPEYDVFALPLADSWDRWVSSRERRKHEIVSWNYTSPDVLGVEDLDAYGVWEDVPEYGHVWRPVQVAAGWAPYRAGRWIWQDPWGWTWVSAEPWGWAPYHYGRWIVVSSRWCWVPVAPHVRHVSYAPALVAFVGGGPGWSVSIGVGGGGYVGWFPLAPRDPFVPWWGRRSGSWAPLPNAVYTNRAWATVVERSVFADARPVEAAFVRDPRILRDVQRAPVLHGPLPVLPTRESIRMTAVERAVVRPPDVVLARPMTARLAPPLAPPTFERKLETIREGRGAPLSPEIASRLVVESREGARAPVAIRPAMRPDRRVDLVPRRDAEGAPPPDPIHSGGRTLASPDTPLIPRPSAGRETVAPARVAPGVVVAPAPVVREERKREVTAPAAPERARQQLPSESAAPQARPVPPQARPVPQVSQPAPAAPEPRTERQSLSRAPRRVAEPGPDPLARQSPPGRGEEKREAPKLQDVKREEKPKKD